jgi:hypothetical protein
MSPSRLPVRQRPLAVGDLCFTRNSRTSPRNNGLLVVIIQIAARSSANPYRIRRIDGQPFPVLGPVKGPHHVNTLSEAVTTARHLQRIDPDALDARDLQVMQARKAGLHEAPARCSSSAES